MVDWTPLHSSGRTPDEEGDSKQRGTTSLAYIHGRLLRQPLARFSWGKEERGEPRGRRRATETGMAHDGGGYPLGAHDLRKSGKRLARGYSRGDAGFRRKRGAHLRRGQSAIAKPWRGRASGIRIPFPVACLFHRRLWPSSGWARRSAHDDLGPDQGRRMPRSAGPSVKVLELF